MDVRDVKRRISERDLTLLNEAFISEFGFDGNNYALIHELASEGWVEILHHPLSMTLETKSKRNAVYILAENCQRSELDLFMSEEMLKITEGHHKIKVIDVLAKRLYPKIFDFKDICFEKNNNGLNALAYFSLALFSLNIYVDHMSLFEELSDKVSPEILSKKTFYNNTKSALDLIYYNIEKSSYAQIDLNRLRAVLVKIYPFYKTQLNQCFNKRYMVKIVQKDPSISDIILSDLD